MSSFSTNEFLRCAVANREEGAERGEETGSTEEGAETETGRETVDREGTEHMRTRTRGTPEVPLAFFKGSEDANH